MRDPRVEVRYLLFNELPDRDWETRWLSTLTADEHSRMQRFKFEALRTQYLATRALCRSSLSLFTGVDPNDWRFERTPLGKPAICEPAEFTGLHFNLTNTASLVACLTTWAGDAGVDAEETARGSRAESIAERFFSRAEVEGLLAFPEQERPLRFFDYWVLKEAYVKACGGGLSIPLDQFSVWPDWDGKSKISFHAGFNDSPAEWQFALYRPWSPHVLAAAIRCGSTPGLTVDWIEQTTL